MNIRKRIPGFTGITTFAAFAAAALLAIVPQSATARDWNPFGNSVKGSGTIKSETRNVSGFSSIALSVPAHTQIVQGNTESVVIETDDNILPLIETVVESGALKIRFNARDLSISTKSLKITVNAKTVEGISVGGSGDVRAASLKSPQLKASIAGSGDVEITSLDATTVTVAIAGSGSFAAGGKADSLATKISGSGDLKTGKLETNSVKVSVAGSGDATVWAKETLTVSVAGSGDVRYYGDARVTQSVAGSGSVKRLGSAP